jgi:Ricin-type beta-trefoil lectin domain-like
MHAYRKTKYFLIFIATSIGLSSCGKDHDKSYLSAPSQPDAVDLEHTNDDQGELNLSIMHPIAFGTFSLLKDLSAATRIQRTGDITYPICLYGNHQIDPERRAKARTDLEAVLNRWSTALKRDPTWPVKSIRAELVGNTSSCPFYKGGVRVLKVKSDINVTRASASYWFTEINNAGKSTEYYSYAFGDPYFYMVMLHEVGHILGLGDAYSEEGYQMPSHQPEAVMNNHWVLKDLTEDDVDAINHVWQRLRWATAAPCPSGYVQSGAAFNKFQNTFCIRAKAAGTVQIKTFAGKCLALSGSIVSQADCNGDMNQQFNFAKADSDVYQIKSAQNGQCLDIEMNSIFGGARLRTWQCHGGHNQQFLLKPAGEGGYTIVAQHSQKCVDIAWSSPRSGAAAIQWSCHGKLNQVFGLSGLN